MFFREKVKIDFVKINVKKGCKGKIFKVVWEMLFVSSL